MTPAPGPGHQIVALALAARLRDLLRGSPVRALAAPCDVVLGHNVVQPDVLVARKSDFSGKDLPAPPLLVVEILSPSTRHLDRGRKRELYAEAGVPHYWIVDPDEPAITTYELVDGDYRESAHASGDENLEVHQPVHLRITPAELLDD
jgi:Uma2 family endonuclease